MALSLAGESVPGDGGDTLGMSPASIAAYYPSFLPPAQYFEAAPDFFQPLKSLGGLVPSSPPLPPFTFSRVPAFLSQPPPLPAEPFPGLPLPLYAKPPAPFPSGEGSPRRTGAPGSPPPPYPSPPRRAARSPGGGGAAEQSYRYHFTEEELNAVLYGAFRSSQLAGSLHAISGLRVPPASPGKGVSARGCRRREGHGAEGRSLPAGCAMGFGDCPQRAAGGPAAARLTGHRRGHVGLPFPAVFLRYEPTPGESREVIRAAAAVGGGRTPLPLPCCTCTAGAGLNKGGPSSAGAADSSSAPLLDRDSLQLPEGRGPALPAPPAAPSRGRAALSPPCPPQGSRCCGWRTGTCVSSESSARTPSPKESASALSKAKWSTPARSRLTTTIR